MGGYLSFNIKAKEDEIIMDLKKLTIEKVYEILDYVKIDYNGSFLLNEQDFSDVLFC